MPSHPVFYDPKGRRAVVAKSTVRVAGVIVGIASTLFILSLFALPSLFPGFKAAGGTERKSVIPTKPSGHIPTGLILGKYRTSLISEVEAERQQRKNQAAPKQQIIGFFAPWMDSSIASLRANVGRLTALAPQWLKLTPDGAHLDDSDFDPTINPRNDEALRLCRKNGVEVMPILSNTAQDTFQPAIAHKLLSSAKARSNVAIAIKQWLVNHQCNGINIDLENLDPRDEPLEAAFLAEVKRQFRGTSFVIDVEAEADDSATRIKGFVPYCDAIVVMAYDEHGDDATPGPIAGLDWTEKVLKHFLSVAPPSQIILGMGAYSYDWHTDSKQADTDTFSEALATAADSLSDQDPASAVTFDPASYNSTYSYTDGSVKHTVWMQDGVSAYNQWTLGRSLQLGGFSLWAMGQEDPTVWNFLDRSLTSAPSGKDSVTDVRFPYDVENVGKGELLTVKATMSDGSRTIQQDPSNGLIYDSSYRQFPTPYVIAHTGYREKYVALTFDDGPDPTYTPQILDILRDKGVPATFFCIGKNIENNPNLVAREYAEGNEIGSHTFFHPNLGLVTPFRAELELNATQRSIQTVTDRSTILFRPPYNADRDPATPVEVGPIVMAAKMGYITVGESIDPRDWDPFVVDDDTQQKRPRTVQDIVDETLSQVKQFDVPQKSNRDGGNCILLHDAGGDRSKTVEALPQIIDSLRAAGYKFCLVSDLAKLSRDKVMPPLSAHDRFLVRLDYWVFTSIFTGLQLLAICFLSAIALGLLRMLIVFPLSALHDRRLKRAKFDPLFRPPVSAIVAAYNEESVIVSTVAAILASNYPVDEVIVVDDGSTDQTAARIEAAFAGDSRVKLMKQTNSGKSQALNAATTVSTSEVLVSVDADTVLDPKAVGLLVRHFQRDEMAAVAGNVQVGNPTNAVTIWQSIEYTTSQNLDRRAYAYLNAITVVPGAIGAWRKSAIEKVGGHLDDTLAEDMDLTWRLRMAGYTLETESGAFAFTEAPETIRAFYKQRFRWAYGTLQCLFKHKRAVFRYGAFGKFSLPGLWLFQIFYQALAPLIDLQVLVALAGVALAFQSAEASVETTPLAQAAQSLSQIIFLYALFFVVELTAGIISYRLERRKLGQLWWLFLQRFVYRQVMYFVVIKALRSAVRGARQGWGKLDRKASVQIQKSGRGD